MDFSKAAYYADQTEWLADDFYSLNRYLARMFLHSDKRMAEIEALDLSKMSEETKVMMKVLLLFQKKHDFFERENLSELKTIGPLRRILYLVEKPRNVHELYTQYNIAW